MSSTPVDSIVINELSPSKPTTLLLRTNRPHFYNIWTLNNQLRLKNEKLFKRQQSSCCIAFYSLWLCISAGVMSIIIYRFTDECPRTTDQKQFFIICLRYWLFLAAICIGLLACSGVIFGACRYFRSQPHNLLYDNEYEVDLINKNSLLPITTMPYSYSYPTTSLTNGASNRSFRQTQNHDDEHSNTTRISFSINTSPQRKIPPFNYDELPSESNPIINSKSPNLNNNNNNNKVTNSSKSRPVLIFQNTCPNTPAAREINLWEKQRRLSSLR